MKRVTTERGFQLIECPKYLPEDGKFVSARVVQQSSAIGNAPDAFDRPGSSYLWFGEDHHLDRAQVKELVAHLNLWLETGRLFSDGKRGGQ